MREQSTTHGQYGRYKKRISYSKSKSDASLNLMKRGFKGRNFHITKNTSTQTKESKNQSTRETDSEINSSIKLIDLPTNHDSPSLISTINVESIYISSDEEPIILDGLTILPETTDDEKIEALKLRTKEKYKIPEMVYSNKLEELCIPLLPIVNLILKGKVISEYYENAKVIYKASNRSSFIPTDVPRKKLDMLMAGFYGQRRQIIVRELILSKYKGDLWKSKNPTIKWWGPDDFATFVLAPEVLLVLAILQMKKGSKKLRKKIKLHLEELSKEELEELQNDREDMYDIFQDTVEYGLRVTDDMALEQWQTEC